MRFCRKEAAMVSRPELPAMNVFPQLKDVVDVKAVVKALSFISRDHAPNLT